MLPENVPLDVDVNHAHPFFNFQIRDFTQQHHTGIVNQDVNLTHLLDGCGDHTFPVRSNGHIKLCERNFTRKLVCSIEAFVRIGALNRWR